MKTPIEINPVKVELELFRDYFIDHGKAHLNKSLKKFIGENNIRCHFYNEGDYYLSYTPEEWPKPYLLFWNPSEATYFKLAWNG